LEEGAAGLHAPSLLIIHKFISVQLMDAIVATMDRDPAILQRRGQGG